MPGITKFGVWEKETREFIDAVSGDSRELKDQLTDWLYSSGIKISQMEQQKVQTDFNYEAIKKDGKRPEVTLERILANKKVGFDSVFIALLDKFAADDDGLRAKIEEQYKIYAGIALKNHVEFYQLQADITSTLNKHINDNPDVKMTTEETMAYVVAQYVETSSLHPNLRADIESHLLLQKEFMLMKAQTPVSVPVGANTSTLYGASAAAAATLNEQKREEMRVQSNDKLGVIARFRTCG
jgi:hypothetical protein